MKSGQQSKKYWRVKRPSLWGMSVYRDLMSKGKEVRGTRKKGVGIEESERVVGVANERGKSGN